MPTTETNGEIVQGTEAWRELRRGKITASRFADVLTQPKTKAAKAAGELSQTARSYMLDILADILSPKYDHEPPTTRDMEWGTEHEPAARELYETQRGVEVKEIPFWSHPEEPMIGGSPDGLVGEDGGIEIKCPARVRIHLGYIDDDVLPKDHVAQVQGHMWLGGREWWDFVSYHPWIPELRRALWVHRVYRDEAYIKKLEQAVFAFHNNLLKTLYELKLKTGG